MSAIATKMARWIWFWGLWLMRRPYLKRWQRAAFWDRVPEEKREASWEHFKKQNTFARKNAVKIISFMLTIVMASLLLQATYAFLSYLIEIGFLKPLHA